MAIINVADITKSAVAQTMGQTYMEKEGVISALESGKLVDIGKDIGDMERGYDVFCRALIDVIGKMEIDEWEYRPEIQTIYMDSWEWGAFLERIKLDMPKIITDDLFNLVADKDYSKFEHTAYIPVVHVKGYDKASAFTIPLTIKTSYIETAFTNYSEMSRFISSLRENRNQFRKLVLDSYAHILVGAGIAISSKVTNTSIHLLTEAKQAGIIDASATWETARHNTKYNNFCLKRIATIREYMGRHNTAFNNKSTIPPSGRTNLFLLNAFEKDCRFTSEAETFHPEKLSVGDYELISAWQSFAEKHTTGKESSVVTTISDYEYSTVSKVIVDDTNNDLGIGSSAEVDLCIAFLCDYKAIGIYNQTDRVTSSYTASADFWNEFEHVKINYVLDADYGMVAFLMD